MRIEYTTPAPDDMEVTVKMPDGTTAAEAACLYKPEPVSGLRLVPAGKFRAIGDSGRVEEATVQFDLRKGEFVIQPKKLVSTGFDFDKPVSVATQPATPPVTSVPAQANAVAQPVKK